MNFATPKQQFIVSASINGKPAQIITRNVASPDIQNGTLRIDDLGISLAGVDASNEFVLCLTLTKVQGP